MVDWKTLSIRADCSVERLRSFWNCASRHQGNPNNCARASVASTSEKTMASHAARQVGLIRKPLEKRLLLGLRQPSEARLAEDNLLLHRGRFGGAQVQRIEERRAALMAGRRRRRRAPRRTRWTASL